MKCKLSRDINQKKDKDLINLVRKNGAVSVTMLQTISTSRDFSTRITLPNTAKRLTSRLLTLNPHIKAISYKFSGTDYTVDGFANAASGLEAKAINRINALVEPEAISHAEAFFNRKNKTISPTRGNVNRIIAEGSIASILDSDTRSFVRVSDNDKEIIWNRIQRDNKEFKNKDNKNLRDYRKALEALVVSGLYRGYDILFDGPFNSEVIQDALAIYNKGLNPTSSKVLHITEFPGREAIGVDNIEAFIGRLDKKVSLIQPTRVYTSNGILNKYLTDGERTELNRYKKASNASKRFVVDKLASVFTRYMPGADTEVLTSYEIEQQYGYIFADKKGFVTGNTIVLNIDQLDATTAFHEFGHYYMSWLKSYDKREFDRLLSFTADKYQDQFKFYKNTYDTTGLKFNTEEILEEIFVEELGMIGAKELNNVIDKEEIAAGTLVKGDSESIEVFMDKFMMALVKTKKVSRADVNFDLYTSISQLFDISAIDITNSSLFSDIDVASIDSMKAFFIEKYSPEDVFEGLISRGLITRVGKDRIKLTDEKGNRVDKDGNYVSNDLTYRYKFPESRRDFINKRELVKDITGFLDKFKNHADVRFATSHEPQDVVAMVRANTGALTLDTVKNVYLNAEGQEHARVTEYLQKQFTADMDKESYIAITMFFNAKEAYKRGRANSDDDRLTIEKDAIESASEFMANSHSDEFKKSWAEVAELFEFKTEEGTYLHNVSELFVRAINYSNTIDYGNDMKGGWQHFMGPILDHITAIDRDSFAQYFEDFFFSRLNGQKDTKEYQDFYNAYDFVNKNMDSLSTPHARDLLKLLSTTLKTHVFGSLKGPLTLMPEVKLSSASLGVAGTIDLLVIDGNGKAHIFDYKTKEIGKQKNWDYNSPVRLTKELGGYNENAMMKASIQTSMYKLMLLEMGIEVGPANVFYIESIVKGRDKAAKLSDTNKMRYKPEEITKKSLIDVSAELVTHFGKTRTMPDIFKAKNDATDIMGFITTISGGVHLDRVSNVKKASETIYNAAIRETHRTTDPNVAKVLQMLGHKTKKGGLVVKLWGGSSHTIDPSITDRGDIIKEIERLIVERHDIKAVEAKLEQQFYDPTTRSRSKQDQTIAGMLAGMNGSNAEYIKMSSRLNLGLDFSGFGMVKDKVTDEHRLLILNHENVNNLPFGQKHHNIFGNYITNNIAKAKHPTIKWSNTNYNMRLVKAGLMMAKMRQQDPDFKISMVIANDSFRNGKTVPRLIDVSTILYVTKAMIELAVESDPSSVPDSISEMLKDEKLFESKTYIPNPINALGEFLSASLLDPFDHTDIFKGKGKGVERATLVRDAIDNLNGRQDYEELLDRLHDFRITLENRLQTEDSKIADPLWTLTDQVIMHIMGFNHTVSPFNTTFVQNFLVTTSKASNTYSAAFNRKIEKSSRNVREDFNLYKTEHNKLIQKLADSRNVNLSVLGPSALKTSMKEIYKNLYINDNKDRKTAFILKSPNHSTLNGAEKEYIRYLQKKFQEFSNLSSFRRVNIPDGWVPLMPKSRAGQEIDRTALDQAHDQVKLYNLDSNFHEESENTLDSTFSVENRFKGQLPGKGDTIDIGFTDARRRILGVDETGEEYANSKDRPLSKIEDNLENILDVFAIASFDAHYYRDVTSFGRALFYNVKRFEKTSGLAYSQLIETLTLIQKRVINHQESDQSNKALKVLNKFTTNAAIAGTVNQFLLEAFTNPMVTSANYLGDKIYGSMFSGTREFSLKSYSAASAIVWNPMHKHHDMVLELDKLYGITSSDTRALKDMMNMLEKNSIWQTKHLMYMNKQMMEVWQKITLVAFMIEQGSFYAHSLDGDGNLVYDETKDKRFFDSTVSKEAQLEKKKQYDAVKEEMAQHRNGLTGDNTDEFSKRKLKKAWTTFDSNYIKEMIVELYSSMDESSKSLAMYYTHMSFLSKMRSWIFAKIPRYFQKPMTAEQNQSASRLQRVVDPDAPDGFRYEYKGIATEGILYTVQSMSRQLAEYKLQLYKKGSLEEHQKKNLSKLLADLFIFSAMSAGAAGLFAALFDDDDEKSELAKLAYQRWMMATGDVFLLKSLIDMTTGNSSMFISVSVGMRLVSAITNASVVSGQALIDPEVTVDDALKATNNVLRNSAGFYRTLEMGYDAATTVDE